METEKYLLVTAGMYSGKATTNATFFSSFEEALERGRKVQSTFPVDFYVAKLVHTSYRNRDS